MPKYLFNDFWWPTHGREFSRKLSLPIVAMVIISVALFMGATFFVPAFAQEATTDTALPIVDDTAPPPSPTDDPPPVVDTTTTGEPGGSTTTTPDATAPPVDKFSEDVILDETVTFEDLGAKEATILPDSTWHGFKRFGRNIQETFTFNPIKKAEVKLQHANQQLSEVKQMLEEKGVDKINPNALENSISVFKDKLGEVRGQAVELKQAGDANPEVIDNFLNELTDKQFKQQKVLDGFVREVLEVKQAAGDEASPTMNNIINIVEDTKDNVIENFAGMLTEVGAPEKVEGRLTQAIANQKGSEFNDLKHLEMLKKISDKAPTSIKEAIKQAEKNTITNFETKVKALPPSERANQFKKYIKDSTADETKLVGLLNEIKFSSNIPADILAKIEEAKEIAVRKFENKLKLIEDQTVEERFFRNFSNDDVGDLVAMEDFKNRMKKGTEGARLMGERHDQSIEAFKKTFTDLDSQLQADKFQKLSQEMLINPSPKTFKLLQTLEDGVRSDPVKAAFLDEVQKDMKRNFENQFRREGDRFMDRMSSFDPYDLAAFEGIDFDEELTDRFALQNAKKFKDQFKEINDPDEFDIYRERFFGVPEFVVNEIRQNDIGFQDAMQFKVRKMETVRAEREREMASAVLDYQERELNFQADRVQRQTEEEFWNQLNQADPNDFETRKNLWENKINNQYQLVEQRFGEQQRIFEERMQMDPWCDELCREIQLASLEQQLRHEKERLGDDLLYEQRRIEIEQTRNNQPGPFGGPACDTPESCEVFCQANQSAPECRWFTEKITIKQCPFPGYWDPSINDCRYPDNAPRPPSGPMPACQPGQFFDFKVNTCVTDPYYKPPTDFQQCGWGTHWNDIKEYCEPDFFGPQPIINGPFPGEPYPGGPEPYPGGPYPMPYPGNFCGPGMYWDDGARECIPDNYQQCGPNSYFDFYEGRCKSEWQDCGSGAYWDARTESCQKEQYTQPKLGQCPPGFTANEVDQCVPSWKTTPVPGPYPAPVPLPMPGPYPGPQPCPLNYYWDNFSNTCVTGSDVKQPTPVPPGACPTTVEPVCGSDNKTYDNKCLAQKASTTVKYYGRCSAIDNTQSCSNGTWWEPRLNKCLNNGDYTASRSGDCTYGWTWMSEGYCTKDSSIIGECKTYCEPVCTGTRYCQYNQFGCADRCVESSYPGPSTGGCTPPAWWDSITQSCKPGSSTTACNYNGTCDSGESSGSCPADCGGYADTCNYDGICQSTESSLSCPPDCGGGNNQSCGYNNTCAPGDYCADTGRGWCCPNGTVICPDGSCVNSMAECSSSGMTCDYDGICESNEDSWSCSADCGGSPGTGSCPSGFHWHSESGGFCINDQENYSGTCYDSTGSNVITCPSMPSGSTYCPPPSWWDPAMNACNPGTSTTACNYNGTCDSGESTGSCPADCGSSSGNCPAGQYWYVPPAGGTGWCQTNDASGTYCPPPSWWDPAMNACNPGTTSGWCGDNVCDSNETSSICPSDCGGDYVPPPPEDNYVPPPPPDNPPPPGPEPGVGYPSGIDTYGQISGATTQALPPRVGFFKSMLNLLKRLF
ncbi:MAG: DUF5667 domain-containing protein [Patescibacteria group bacterium]